MIFFGGAGADGWIIGEGENIWYGGLGISDMGETGYGPGKEKGKRGDS